MPLFSVIIPLYNKAPYVGKTIDSVLGQTLGNYELIIVDNGSNDGSHEIVAAFTDHRIKIVRLEENVGVSNARNKGVSLASAPHITFLDADDWWEPTFLEEMAGLIDRHPDAGIYGTGYYIVKNGKKRLAPIGVDEGFEEGEINYCAVYAKTLCMPLTSITVAMPKAIFDETGGFKPHLKLGEDFDLWVRIALKHKTVFLNKPLSNYNQDVDVTYRGTHHLRDPKEHMLWNLGYLEPEEKTNADYKQLIDNLRTYSLLPYLLTKQYRSAARTELAKVDWNRQPAKTRRLYQRPVWILKKRAQILILGSFVKQRLISLRNKK
ncbi:MAG: glycosyltransferase family 2 protein [Bacteroidales bacterium]|nr:glycosyltransferase family 2 protein [Bacteroidales bacterium]